MGSKSRLVAAVVVLIAIAIWCLRAYQEAHLAQARQLLTQSGAQIASGDMKAARSTLDSMAQAVDIRYTLLVEETARQA